MTELLHMKDNYIKEFDAEIIDIGDGYIVLNRTAFYPEGGGQSGDRGFLSSDDKSLRIVEAKKKEAVVQHRYSGNSPFEIGDHVHGVLDWEYRYECMRFHTAQHILSRWLQLNHGLETAGNNIKPGESRADFTPIDHFSEALIEETEKGVNEILGRSLDVRLEFMERNEAIRYLHERGYQTRYLDMVPDHVKEFRVLLIGDYDAASCAGTHVANTTEIGKIAINKTKNVGAGKQRLYFSLV